MLGSTKWLRPNDGEDAKAAPACFLFVLVAWCCRMTSHAQNTVLDFIASVESWLDDLSSSGRSPGTIECYRRDMNQFRETVAGLLGHLEISDMEMVGQREIDLVACAWGDQGALPQTIARRFSAVRSFSCYLCLASLVNCSKILAARYPTAPKVIQPAMADSCYAHFNSGADTVKRWTAARDQAAFAIMEEGALTPAETIGLNFRDVLWTACAIAVAAAGRSVRIAPLAQETLASVDRYLSVAPFDWHDESPLFVNCHGRRLSVRSIQMSFRRRADGLGLPPSGSPMSLRHRAAQRMADAGHPPAFVADRLGIAVSSVARYYGGARSSQPAAAKRGNR